MNLQLSDEEFRALDQAFDAAAPSPDEGDGAPVPADVVTELRYKLLAAESRRDHAMDLTDEEAAVLSVCFEVGAEMVAGLPEAVCQRIVGKLT